ncbi:Pogo transposable element with krab domain-like protein [Elysia marginata]|uniref:Pogo transposable element with krab domain-like protein n=1 Tax=Elysia marginata TaxID=1093978 RepID=A0AAV4FQ54_9GAST|nr:Pogo transposable element with krab domain-like protein [Elysia marginata]
MLLCSRRIRTTHGDIFKERMPTTNLLERFQDSFMQISPNGWVNADIFKTWLRDVFLPLVKNKRKPVVLFVDGHESHNSDRATLEMGDANGVILYGLLAHASHTIQPLDLSVFGSMKAEWPTITKRHLDREEEMPSVINFATLLKQVWETCAKTERALKIFAKSEIFPLDPHKALGSGKTETARIFQTEEAQAYPINISTASSPLSHA